MRSTLAAVAVLAGIACTAPAAEAAPPVLVGTVGPGFTISLTRDGRPVSSLRAGRYTLLVRDRAQIHNFRLFGPGVERATGIPFVGSRRFAIVLRRGVYRYECFPHPSSMHGRVRVA